MIPEQNTGVLLGRRPTDYVADELVGALPYEERNPSGDWRPFLPGGERQYNNGGDSMSCVTFSAENCIEIQEKFLTGSESNYSDRWTAKMSGTTPEGNYLWKVADTIRKQGLVPEQMYPQPPTPWNWAKYHENIPEPLYSQLIAQGADWLNQWEISYEWIEVSKASFLKHLKHAPLQVVFPNHAVTGILCEADVIKYFDHYEHAYNPVDWTANMAVSKITDALKIVLTPRNMTNSILVRYGNTYGFFDPNVNPDSLLDDALNRGYPLPMKPGVPVTAPISERLDWDAIRAKAKTLSD